MLLYHTFVFSFPRFFIFRLYIGYSARTILLFYYLIESEKENLVDNSNFYLKDKKERMGGFVCLLFEEFPN